MPLPGHLWNISDQYGAYWTFEPEPTYVHVWYFKQRLDRDFPQFDFTMVVAQRDPSRPVPIPYICPEEDDHESEKIKTQKEFVAHENQDF
jgi:hypothetical protein